MNCTIEQKLDFILGCVDLDEQEFQELLELIKEVGDEGYTAGYDAGRLDYETTEYDKGFNSGRQVGFDEGYDSGYEDCHLENN